MHNAENDADENEARAPFLLNCITPKNKTTDSVANTAATALADSMLPASNCAKIYSGAVCVRNGKLPLTKTVAPNSPSECANVSSAPLNNPPRSAGKMTNRNASN